MKKHMGRIIASFAVLALAGCATIPMGPSVRVLPAPGKTFEEFQVDDLVCRQWAGQSIGISPQETINNNTAAGAVVGTVVGTGLGLAVGAATGHPGAGAAIGAGSGLLVGTASGAEAGNAYGWEAQRRYDNTYVQCMYAKGNQVPGTVHQYRTRKVAPTPPDLNSVPPDYVPNNAPVPPPSQ